jgi:hypothetical protein
VLENDEALQYYRSIRARYGSDDYLIITYTPNQDLFGEAVLADLKALRDEVAAMDNVESVISLLDVPLLQSPPVTLDDLRKEIRTLETPGTDRSLAEEEFLSSPMYRNLIISTDGKTTAMQVNFRRDETWHRLLKQRNELREKNLLGVLSPDEQEKLDAVSAQFDVHSIKLRDKQSNDIAEVRSIIDRHRDTAELHLGGVPMIVSDSIDFIRHDLLTFGIGVLCFLIVILAHAGMRGCRIHHGRLPRVRRLACDGRLVQLHIVIADPDAVARYSPGCSLSRTPRGIAERETGSAGQGNGPRQDGTVPVYRDYDNGRFRLFVVQWDQAGHRFRLDDGYRNHRGIPGCFQPASGFPDVP